MNNFIYDIPTRVYFGENQLSNLGKELRKYGKRVLLTYGGGSIKKIGLYDKILDELKKGDFTVFELSGIEPNPRIESVREGALICKKENIDVLLAVGGGSTIDTTKFIAAGACTDTDPWDFFSKNAPIEKALPIVTILTLSATGSEMNAGGVISNTQTQDKIGRLSPNLLPKASFLDPSVTYTVNKFQTACGVVDIFSHIMEVYFNTQNSLYMLDCFMEGLMKTLLKYGPVALKNPNDYEARANIMWASSWAINGFISSDKNQAWSCHPIEHQLSAIYDITHGLGLALVTPRWLEYCLDETTVSKYYQFGTNVFDIDKNLSPMEVAKQSIQMLSKFFFETLELDNTFTKVGIKEEDFEIMAEKACNNSVIQGFKPLNKEDIINIFKMCM